MSIYQEMNGFIIHFVKSDTSFFCALVFYVSFSSCIYPQSQEKNCYQATYCPRNHGIISVMFCFLHCKRNTEDVNIMIVTLLYKCVFNKVVCFYFYFGPPHRRSWPEILKDGSYYRHAATTSINNMKFSEAMDKCSYCDTMKLQR